MSRTRRILARDWEVRALLEGRKTVWRRPIANPPTTGADAEMVDLGESEFAVRDLSGMWGLWRAPYRPGDLVSVREACHLWFPEIEGQPETGWWRCRYRADNAVRDLVDVGWEPNGDGADECGLDVEPKHWRSSATMPAWAVRHQLLRVVRVRPERLRGVTDEDAFLHGVSRAELARIGVSFGDASQEEFNLTMSRSALRALWDIDYPRHPVASNPWTWRIEMAAEQGNRF